jgi:hypothetical protein
MINMLRRDQPRSDQKADPTACERESAQLQTAVATALWAVQSERVIPGAFIDWPQAGGYSELCTIDIDNLSLIGPILY